MHGMAIGAQPLREPPKEVAVGSLQESKYLSLGHAQNFTPDPNLFSIVPYGD
jgi:hypothetical protein